MNEEMEEKDNDFERDVFDSDLEEWLSVHKAETKNKKLSLYRYIRIGDNTFSKEKAFIKVYRDEIPTDDDIGSQFGGGKYLQIVTIKGNKGEKNQSTTRTVLIDSIFDKKIVSPVINNDNGSKSFLEGIQLAMNMQNNTFQMMLPLLTKQDRPNNPATESIGVYRMLQDVLKQNLRDNQDFYKQMGNNQFSQSSQPDFQEPVPEKSLLEQLTPLLSAILPLLPQQVQQPVRIAQRVVPAVPAIKKAVTDIRNTVKQPPAPKIQNKKPVPQSVGMNYGEDMGKI